jgi:ketosteroid isomerase-like protein
MDDETTSLVDRSNEIGRIRHVIEVWVGAFRDKDVDAALSIHAKSIVSFDIVPPLRYVGAEEYRQPWETTFASFEGPILMEIKDLVIEAHGELAFSYCLVRMAGTPCDGEPMDYWFRWTACYRKIGDEWLIMHDHSSAPTEFSDSRAVLDLTP